MKHNTINGVPVRIFYEYYDEENRQPVTEQITTEKAKYLLSGCYSGDVLQLLYNSGCLRIMGGEISLQVIA